MISRIRVEVRAASMAEAEREAEMLLHHANIAGYLEGIGMTEGRITDHHFGAKLVKPGEDDPWMALGLTYEGRIVLTSGAVSDPGGGLKQYSYRVLVDDPDSESDGKDVTEQFFVLERHNPITRENAWDPVPQTEPVSPDASAEEILESIRRLANVTDVEVGYDRTQRDGAGWRVNVTFEPSPPEAAPMCASVPGETLREAALAAYEMCDEGATVVGLTEERLVGEIVELERAGKRITELRVGSARLGARAADILGPDHGTARRLRGLFPIKVDGTLPPDSWEFVTAEDSVRPTG